MTKLIDTFLTNFRCELAKINKKVITSYGYFPIFFKFVIIFILFTLQKLIRPCVFIFYGIFSAEV
jgi:hypothetical protein